MKKIQLGKSDIYITELTLGAMSLGTNKEKAKQIIDYAIDAGINHIDTADLYDFGLNEEIVGDVIKDKRNQIILTTKVGNHFDKNKKKWFWDPSKTYIIRAVKDSLRRLNTDYIDFCMLHGGTIDDPIDETILAFETLKKEGAIRAYGISSIRPNVIRKYVEKSSIDGVMTQYNLLDRRPEEEVLDLLERNQISVLARGPLGKGMLSDTGEQVIEKKARDGYLDYSYQELLNIYQELKQYSKSESIQKLALQYVLHHPAVASAVFGASSVEQVKENVNNYQPSTFSKETYEELQDLTKAITYKQHR
ncbi:aldo/keto reductase [Oceanobacillus piezotolerans]|uniref:Aldo/keto reductase n=1 Tax=Oceanobacillus piezotolerans TaxID=2448030 RepID=A0A498DAK2_9BACI|nr:aldo/keto reductase [Oceanobacillus piezotolerans]RLL48144.1 aldo/keto reductase [Oceanobacillus piezotolerans]